MSQSQAANAGNQEVPDGDRDSQRPADEHAGRPGVTSAGKGPFRQSGFVSVTVALWPADEGNGAMRTPHPAELRAVADLQRLGIALSAHRLPQR